MEFSLNQIAGLVGGVVEGDGERKVSNVGKIESGKEGDLCFLANDKYENYLYTTDATAVLIGRNLELKKEVKAALIRVEDPYSAFSAILTEVNRIQSLQMSGKEDPVYIAEGVEIGDNPYLGAFSYIGKNSKLGKNVKIYPQVYIGENCTIGDNTILYPGVKVYANCQIGNYCTLHGGVIIGGDGFGFAPQDDGSYKKVPQIGNVILEDHVEIGANTTVDCGTMGSTIIKNGAKIDNLVMIAHNVEVGEHTVLAGQTGIAGSTKIGKHCVFAGQVGLVGHIEIPDKTTIASKSGVSNTIKEPGKTYFGYPAQEIMDYKKSFVLFRRLPQLQDRIKELEQKVLNLAAADK